MFGQWCWNVNTSLFFSHIEINQPQILTLHIFTVRAAATIRANPHWPLVN
jgi:hypothetical protein